MPTIAAIATPPGQGGISILRLSGPGSKSLLSRVFLPHSQKFENFRPWTLHHGVLVDSEDKPLDDVLAVYMPGPKTYSGEDMAEIHCHGGNLVASRALESLLRLGARPAEKGEFTRRAFLNGRMDLSQAEAVAELIAAPSGEALANGMARLEGAITRQVDGLKKDIDDLRALAKVAIDFPDDEIEDFEQAQFAAAVRKVVEHLSKLIKSAARANLMANGCLVVLAGNVNVGKSSLLNALAGQDRALVTDLPGTTRDFIEVSLDFDGLPVRLVDTAGLRPESPDKVENLGMNRSRELLRQADLAVFVLDAGAPRIDFSPVDFMPGKCLLLWNKIDMARPPEAVPDWAKAWPQCAASAKTGENLEEFAALVRSLLLDADGAGPEEFLPAPNQRQALALEKAKNELSLFLVDLEAGIPCDCSMSHLDTAAQALADVVTLAADDELLDKIFSQFCIGK